MYCAPYSRGITEWRHGEYYCCQQLNHAQWWSVIQSQPECTVLYMSSLCISHRVLPYFSSPLGHFIHSFIHPPVLEGGSLGLMHGTGQGARHESSKAQRLGDKTKGNENQCFRHRKTHSISRNQHNHIPLGRSAHKINITHP